MQHNFFCQVSLSNTTKGVLLLTCSALLFSLMGVFIRFASYTVDNANIVFYRNVTGLLMLLPWFYWQGFNQLKTHKFYMHAWRALIGLCAMYGFFYAIAHIKLSNAMVFTYASPVFIPLVAWLFLKEKMTITMWLSALLGLFGVVLVAKPDGGMINTVSAIGIIASLCAAMAFVTVRALTGTEPVARIVFYFALVGTLFSAVPMLWYARALTLHELTLVLTAGVLATLSQLCMSKAYSYAAAGVIGPTNYLAIIFAGVWGAILWQEYPDGYSIIGMALILLAILLCMPKFLQLFIKAH